MRQNHIRSSKSSKPELSRKVESSSLDGRPLLGRARAPRLDSKTKAEAVDREGLSRTVDARGDVARVSVRYDRPGHLDDAHAQRLLHLSHRTALDEFALVFDSAGRDDFATELAEQAVTSMVGGGETWLDTLNAQVEEEDGGPFLETRAAREFASGQEAHDDTEGFLREAVPTPSAGNSAPFEGVRRGRRP